MSCELGFLLVGTGENSKGAVERNLDRKNPILFLMMPWTKPCLKTNSMSRGICDSMLYFEPLKITSTVQGYVHFHRLFLFIYLFDG